MFDQKRASKWLNSLVGEWSLDLATAESSEHPGFRATGTESVRRVGAVVPAHEDCHGPGQALLRGAAGKRHKQRH